MLQELTNRLFGIKGVIRVQFSELATMPCWILNIDSYIINSFIHICFGMVRGVKHGKLQIPSIIKSNKKLLAIYLSGLYDADGTLPKNPRGAKQLFVDITMKDRFFMIQIKEVLKEFGIDSLKIYERHSKSSFCKSGEVSWEVRIRQHGIILDFLKIIGFHHPDKLRRQNELIAMFK